ncbi:hypothetical protein ACNKHO_19605 [Shigella flexneri]
MTPVHRPASAIVSLQTDKPLKRALHPFGGINVIGRKLGLKPMVVKWTRRFRVPVYLLRKTHNQGVLDAYSRTCCAVVNRRANRSAGPATGAGAYRRLSPRGPYGIRLYGAEPQLQFADLQTRAGVGPGSGSHAAPA